MSKVEKTAEGTFRHRAKSGVRSRRRTLLLEIYDRLYAALGPQGWWPGNGPFEVMVGAILTQNTAWGNVEKALANLRAAGCLNPKALFGIREDRLARLIKPSGYFRIKARRLKSFMRFFFRHYGGDPRRLMCEDPHRLRRDLLGVKGIGPETADSILLYAGSHPWFVVDAYTRRIFSRHQLVPPDVPYETLQDFFMDNLPRDVPLYNEYHALLVRLGKDWCRKTPRCEECPLLPLLGEPVGLCGPA